MACSGIPSQPIPSSRGPTLFISRSKSRKLLDPAEITVGSPVYVSTLLRALLRFSVHENVPGLQMLQLACNRTSPYFNKPHGKGRV